LPKAQPVTVPAELVHELTPFQELESAWLADAPRTIADGLAGAGVSFEVIDTAPAGKTYYLAFASVRDRCEALKPRGEAWWVDEGLCLFAPRTGIEGAALPADLHIKKIALPVEAEIRFATTGAAPTRPLARVAGTSAADPTVAQMVADVDPNRLVAFVADLESFGTRYASTAAGEASATRIGELFRSYGLQTEFEYFQFGTSPSYTTSNVIATLPGHVDPSRVVMISAHYDSRSEQPQTLAPGADDNASGVAVVLEAARILSRRPFDFTVKFVAWGAEEQGLLGSRHHARLARQRGDRIVASVVADMVGYADAMPEDLEIVSDETSQWLAVRYGAAASGYAALQTVRQVRAQFGSDCTSFWEQGYPAACAIEDNPLTNPHYHRTTDTVSTLNVDFLAASARATLALVAELAQPVSTPAPPSGLEVTSQTSFSVFRQARSALVRWDASRDAAAGYHVYRATSSHGEYRRLTTSPLSTTSFVDPLLDPETSFYYVVTAVDRSGRQSNYSGEASDVVASR
jgi:Zn-dependent M28 family amino/carboxypeptidase